MFKLSRNGIIEMSRGDDIEMPLFINKGTALEPIRYSMFDYPTTEIYFGVMLPGQKFENALIKQKYTQKDANNHGDVIIKLKSQDTINLSPGKYFYEIKAKLENEFVNTIIQKTEFWIM